MSTHRLQSAIISNVRVLLINGQYNNKKTHGSVTKYEMCVSACLRLGVYRYLLVCYIRAYTHDK